MSIIDDLRALDTNDPGRWPLPFRAAAVAIAFVAVIAIGIYYFVWLDDKPTLDREKRKETELKAAFEDRQRKAAILEGAGRILPFVFDPKLVQIQLGAELLCAQKRGPAFAQRD